MFCAGAGGKSRMGARRREGAGFGCRASVPAALGGVGSFGIAARCNATSSSAVSEATNALPRTEPVVSAEWLHANLKDPDVKVVCAVMGL